MKKLKIDPTVMAAARSMARSQGFVRVRDTYRLHTGSRGGLVLEWEDHLPDQHGYRKSSWVLHVCPSPFVEFMGRVFPRIDVPFERVDARAASAVDILPPGRPPQAWFGYHEDDASDIAVFVELLEHWFVDVAAPLARQWLADPVALLDVMADRNSHGVGGTVLLFNGGLTTLVRALLAAEVGRDATAREEVAKIRSLLGDEVKGEFAARYLKAFAEMHPDLAGV